MFYGAFKQASRWPVAGALTLTAAKPLNGLPTLTVQPDQQARHCSRSPMRDLAFMRHPERHALLPSGPVQLSVTAVDMSGNVFNGSRRVSALVIDVTPPRRLLHHSAPAIQTDRQPECRVLVCD